MNCMKTNKKGMTEINLTSLVDVCLTLVIIFMVSYPLVMQSGINISAPSLKKTKSVLQETELKAEICINKRNQISLNGSLITKENLPDSLRTLLSSSQEKLVILSAEENVLHDQVVEILDLAKQCGAKKLSIIKQKSSD
jgi:biopolymer transport protein ExbD